MSKELGQIHTVNRSLSIDSNYTGRPFLVDASMELTSQLGHMVRSGCTYKLVGIDLALEGYPSPDQEDGVGGQVSGRISYYSPTKGRVSAWKSAYNAVRSAMKFNGIKPNKMYDFRTPMMPTGSYENGAGFLNAASPTGVNGSEFCLTQPVASDDRGIFEIHNEQLNPKVISNQQIEDSFTTGFGLVDIIGSNPSDFVSNEGKYWDGNELEADEQMEYIPFTMSWTPNTTDIAVNFNWRPDPALYQSILLGQFSIYIDNVQFDSEDLPQFYQLNIRSTFHFAGWKSLFWKPKRRKSKKKTSKRRKTSRRKK